jgi:hypothetical protein
MIEKYELSRRGAITNPFFDQAGYRTFVEQKQKAFLETLARQRAAKKAGS